MNRAIVALLCAVVISWPAPALASGQQQVPQPPNAGQLAAIPDIAGYIAIVIPNPAANLVCETEPTGGNWFDVSYQLNRLIWQVRQLYADLVCALVGILQALANGISQAVNLVSTAINQAWRFAVFVWLTIRAWLLAAWGVMELFRTAINQVQIWLYQIQLYVGVLFDLVLAIAGVLGQLAGQLLTAGLQLIGMLGWIVGLGFGLVESVITALSGTSVPAQLESTSPIYQIIRGIGEGIRDSSIGWMLVLVWGMCYVSFVAWFARFLGVGQSA